MDLMTLAAKITLDDSSYAKGIANAEKAGQALAGKMSAMTVAVGNIAADIIKKGASAVNNVIRGAVDGYADYQQLIGGVETLFKNSANKVAKYAEQSYKTTGLSANQYMETVTSFSASLLQGLKGDTETAAEMANMAVTDMADNANKMGTDISSIQTAYQGFAKQNYTMLDNLKLGYGGTAAEMVRLVNDSKILDHEIENLDGITFDQLVQAIHVVQTQLGVTGTTAKEAADTIGGSKNSLAAAWSDLLVAVTGTDETKTNWWNDPLNESVKKFQESFSTYINNIVPALVQTIGNSGTLVTAIAGAISSLPTDLLSKIAKEGLEAGTEMIGAVSNITHWLIESIANMFSSAKANKDEIADFGKAMGDFLGTAIKDLVTYAPDMLSNIIEVGASLAGGLIQGLFEGLFGKGAEVDKITEQLQEGITDIDLNNAQATGILRYMDTLYQKFGDGVTRTNEWKQAQSDLEKVLPQAGKVFGNYGTDIQGALDTLNQLNKSMRENAIISGMEKARYSMMELLGEQEATAEIARNRATMAEQNKQVARDVLIDSLRSYAAEWYDMNERNIMYSSQERQAAIDISRGMVYDPGTGNMTSLSSLDTETLLANLEYFYQDLALAGREVWDKSELDNVKDLDEVLSFIGRIAEYEKTIEDSTKEADEAERQAAETRKELDIVTASLTKTMQERSEQYSISSGTFITDTDSAASAASGFADKVNSLNFGLFGVHHMPRAVGLDYTPAGFRAELHQGEAILDRDEAQAWRNGRGGSADFVGVVQGLRQDLQNLRIIVGKKTFGQAVVNYGGDGLNDYIGQSNSRYESGYGS